MDEDDCENETGATRRAARRRAGGSRPKRRGEVGGQGEMRDLRGRAGGRTLAPRANRCYGKRGGSGNDNENQPPSVYNYIICMALKFPPQSFASA